MSRLDFSARFVKLYRTYAQILSLPDAAINGSLLWDFVGPYFVVAVTSDCARICR
jgi:hypothetical protein